MRWAVPLLTLLALLTCAGGSGAGPHTRPYIAPLVGDDARIPPLPPEYRTEDIAGIRFAYHPSARDRVRALLDDAEEVRSELSELCAEAVLGSVEVRVAYGSADLERVLPAEAPRASDVVALSEAGLIVLSLQATPSTAGDVRASFRRAMALLALDEVAGREGMPRWFRIGFARHFARADVLARTRTLWWASMRQKLLPLVDLDHHIGERAVPGTVAEAQAADFVRYLLEPPLRASFPSLLASVRAGDDFEAALEATYQMDRLSLENAWREDIAKHKAFLPVLAAATGSWLLIALAVRWRRRSRPQPLDDEPEPDAPKKKKKKVKVVAIAQHAKRREMERGSAQLPEPEVPKVSHNGRWHTLH